MPYVTISAVADLPLSDHPVHRRQPVTPNDVAESRLTLVPDGAVAAGVRADAIISLNDDELMRRALVGLESVRALHLLDALLNLPLRYPIALDDLATSELRILGEAPVGCVDFDSTSVTRTLQVPGTVAAALIRGSRWRTALRKAAAYSGFTQRIVVLPSVPPASATLEAELEGIGIWLETSDGDFEEVVAPQPFVPRYFKAAGWRFSENACRRALGTDWRVADPNWAACC